MKFTFIVVVAKRGLAMQECSGIFDIQYGKHLKFIYSMVVRYLIIVLGLVQLQNYCIR